MLDELRKRAKPGLLSACFGNDHAVAAGAFRTKQCVVCRSQRLLPPRIAPHVGQSGGEADLTNRFVGVPIDQLSRCELFTGAIQLVGSFIQAVAAEQDDELLTPVARDVTIVVRNPGQGLGDELEYTVSRVMSVPVINIFEAIDIAERNTERLSRGFRFFVLAFKDEFERAPVGQSGEMIAFSIGPCPIEPKTKFLRFLFALTQLHFGPPCPLGHFFNKSRQAAGRYGRVYLVELVHMTAEL